MRMSANQLIIHLLRHRLEIEMRRFLRKLGMKNDLKQHIPKLLSHVVHIERVDCLQELATFVHQTFSDRLMILL